MNKPILISAIVGAIMAGTLAYAETPVEEPATEETSVEATILENFQSLGVSPTTEETPVEEPATEEENGTKNDKDKTNSKLKIPEKVAAEKKKVIILYKSEIKNEHIDKLKNMGGKIKHVYSIIPGIAATVDESYIQYLESDENVSQVFEDKEVHALLDGSIPQINADQAHLNGFSGSGVNVCIIDTGVRDDHPALNPLINEIDFFNDDTNADDDNGHGTHVAGIVASTDPVIKGVAFGSSLLAAKVLGSDGVGDSSDVVLAIQWCVDNGADIISMSLGGDTAYSNSSTCDQNEVMAQASNNAVNQGVIVVASSGNDGFNFINAPACASKVIAVGAVNDGDVRAGFSNHGPLLDVVAPGVSINSLDLGTGFTTKSGTSMAAPHVAGLLALMLQNDPTLQPEEASMIIKTTAIDLGDPGIDLEYGYGRIDASFLIDTIPEPELDVFDILSEELELLIQTEPTEIKNLGSKVSQIAQLISLLEGSDEETHALFLQKFHEYKQEVKNKLSIGQGLQKKLFEQDLDKLELKIKMKSLKLLEQNTQEKKIHVAFDWLKNKKELKKIHSEMTLVKFANDWKNKDKKLLELETKEASLFKEMMKNEVILSGGKITDNVLKSINDEVTKKIEKFKPPKDDHKKKDSKKKNYNNNSEGKSKNHGTDDNKSQGNNDNKSQGNNDNKSQGNNENKEKATKSNGSSDKNKGSKA